jgi:homogentisate 1,2-dioxygenase
MCLALAPQTASPQQVFYEYSVVGNKGVIVSPRMRTLDKMPTETRGSSGNQDMDLKLTPTVNSDGSITTKVELKLTTRTEVKVHGKKTISVNDTISETVVRFASGETKLLRNSKGGVKLEADNGKLKVHRGEIVVSIKASVVKDQG